ncbi:hypothetical protein BDZ45DRAFT_604403 [Acephala macrosclerotiorum]|nr:hypothetical protein BDZ45DRAFT_604403 [Acephala macrosclerotiorum]
MTGNPIVFQHREISLDTRLLVLGQEYHVNSAMLKDHSAFFFTFLDSPDKREHVEKKRQLNKETGRGFIYEWVSIIDSDGNGWSLVAEEGVTADPTTSLNLSDFKGDKKFEIDTFDKLLRAMHQEPYTLKSHDQFLAMIKLADYYCALPALSKSLDGPLARGEIRVTVRPMFPAENTTHANNNSRF